MNTVTQKKLKVDGVALHYMEKNESGRQTILCLHALGHSSKDYEQLFQDARFGGYRIIAPDFPGHGHSPAGKEPISSAYLARLIERFIEQLGLQSITVLGNSIGGAVAIRLARENKNITAIQLANPAGLDKGGLASKLFLSGMVWFFKKGVSGHPKFLKWFRYYYEKVLPSTEAAHRREEIIGDAYKLAPILVQGWKSFKLSSEDLKAIAAQLPCPVLVTWAMKDKKVQYRRNIQAVRKIPQLSLIRYNIGHTPILENSKEFLKDLSSFLSTHYTVASR